MAETVSVKKSRASKKDGLIYCSGMICTAISDAISGCKDRQEPGCVPHIQGPCENDEVSAPGRLGGNRIKEIKRNVFLALLTGVYLCSTQLDFCLRRLVVNYEASTVFFAACQ